MTRRLRAWVLPLSAAFVCGCRLFQPAHDASTGGAGSQPSAASQSGWSLFFSPPAQVDTVKPAPLAGFLAPPPELRHTDVPRVDVSIRILMLRVPRTQRKSAEPLWSYAREDILDADVHRRLRENGMRVGVAPREWWDAIRGVLDSLRGRLVSEPEPLHFPPGFPLALELDQAPHDQTLFYINEDGVLTGQTWPASRNVLRLAYALDAAARGRLKLEVVPEVRQRRTGFDWIRTPAGVAQLPRADGMSFRDASFYLSLSTDEILLLAPNANADAFGIIGGAFLTDASQSVAYDRYVLIRPDVEYGNGNDTGRTQ